MNEVVLCGLAAAVLLGAGFLGGCLVGQARHRRLQRELEQVSLARQRSQSDGQQRDEALQRSHQDLEQSRADLQRYQHECQRRQEEAGQYRTQVLQHFQQSAALLQTLTLNYRAVYDHLAAGAAALCEGQVPTLTPETLWERLLTPPTENPAATDEAAVPSPAVGSDAAHHPPSAQG